ncbi:N-acetyl sugar amidotransferase [Azospirillum cavernae]|uniref:N-acetyl sugar amidotransferase n=1 Tax=Azospirillum cavernae TaxID=2320860 RepID=A0A418VKY4_9PROT|nr:N-acetyl sugar amidotransferase [Azospirillum cavernae]RJF76802.1 N-acetyl sugar amidotransferase [Azospirillum cavernae]
MVRYCKTCLMPDTRPRIVFDENGVCNACHTAESKRHIDWHARRMEFLDLVERHRSRDGSYDCIVPWSGGKDSSFIAHRLKFEFGLNPLLVTFSPLLPNDVGVHNREALLQAGFDHLMVRPNQKVSRHLARRFFIERGNPKIHWDAGINAVPVQVAVRYNIPLVIYAEHGESEYGGRVLSEEHRKIRDIVEVLEHQVGDHPANWVDDVVKEHDLAPYLYPEADDVARVGIKAIYFAYFFPWDIAANYEYVKSNIDFRTQPGGRVDGTFIDFDSLDDKIDNLYYYMQYVKFGFGRASRDASRHIYRGRMTREEGLEVARRYDAEFPSTFFADNLDYLGLNEIEFAELVDRHRNPELWDFEGNQWKLRYPPV